MKIAFVARHDQPNSNDDEGAITHALQSLGHEVFRMREVVGKNAWRVSPDIVLCHKWNDVDALAMLGRKGIKRIFWYFDLVNWPGDPLIAPRCRARVDWMTKVLPHVDLGFCTDGDWAAKNPKLVWLPQGADERWAGLTKIPEEREKSIDILFTGIRSGGRGRASFVDEMKARWGARFHHVERGVHGRELMKLIAAARVVVAPDYPVTERYWSNRAYLSLGFGACLLHPRCGLLSQYGDNEVAFYSDREELHAKIDALLSDPIARRELSTNGWERTMREHLYVHRVAKLVEVAKERLRL